MATSYNDLTNLIPRSHERTWKEIDSATFAFRHMVKVLAEELQFPRESIRLLRVLGNEAIETEAYGTKRSDVRNASEGYYFDFIIKIPSQPTDCTTFAIRFTYPISRQQETAKILLNGLEVSDPFTYTEQPVIEAAARQAAIRLTDFMKADLSGVVDDGARIITGFATAKEEQ